VTHQRVCAILQAAAILAVAFFVIPVVPLQTRAVAADGPDSLPPAHACKLPRWRGFNLPDRINSEAPEGHRHNRPFREETIQMIAELGFNFVRLPVDYRHWIVDDDWARIDEGAPLLRELDQVVEWGGRHGVHVNLCLAHAPGYFVVPEMMSDPADLFTDATAQRICAEHWAMLARRYRDIPSNRLSFNLWNETPRVGQDANYEVVTQVVEAIRAQDPDRLIIADGRDVARTPCDELVDLGIAQSFHCYQPIQVTHFMASWVKGADRWGVPTWPRPEARGWLCGPGYGERHATLTVAGPFADVVELRVRIGDVFNTATLRVEADGAVLWEKQFATGPGEGEWQHSEYLEQWQAHLCYYGRDYRLSVPAQTRELRLSVVDGHWLQIVQVGVPAPAGRKATLDLDGTWGQPPTPLRYTHGAGWKTPVLQDMEWLRAQLISPWQALEAKGVGVMAGEFGVFNRTPHDVTLRWLEDCLRLFSEAGWGWALWNFDGAIGILDSDRADVEYEDWEGHKLDRKMLELLQRY